MGGTKSMNPPPEYYAHIKAQPCLACNTHGTHSNPVEAAHVRGVISPKTGGIMHRRHKGLPGWAAIPLCKSCHAIQHEVGEQLFLEGRVPNFGLHLFTNLLTYHLASQVDGYAYHLEVANNE